MQTMASSCDPLRAVFQLLSMGDGWHFYRVIDSGPGCNCDPPRAGTRCSSLDGWNHGPAVCRRLQTWAHVCKQSPEVCGRLQTFGERLQTRASSCDPLLAGLQQQSHAGRVVVAIPCGPGLDAVPWIPGPAVCTTLDLMASMMHNLGSMGTWLEFDRVINSGPGCNCDPPRAGTRAVPSMDPWPA